VLLLTGSFFSIKLSFQIRVSKRDKCWQADRGSNDMKISSINICDKLLWLLRLLGPQAPSLIRLLVILPTPSSPNVLWHHPMLKKVPQEQWKKT
jgi:hypothetical protein